LQKKSQILISLFLLISISWQCAAKSAIYIHFKLNQDELAKTVCENKDKPKSCCAAKCQLNKEIKKEEKRQADMPGSLKDKTEKSEIFYSIASLKIYRDNLIQIIYFNYYNTYTINCAVDIFHPPTLS